MLNAKSLLYGFSFRELVSSRGIRGVKFSAPIFQAHRLSVKCIYPAISSISNLLSSCGPFTVAVRIMSVIVNPINGVFIGRPAPHITNERHKRIIPLNTNHYSPAAIVTIGGIFGVVAPRPQRLPAMILRGSGHPVLSVGLLRVAAARGDAPFLKVITSNCGKIAALTSAVPISPFVRSGSTSNSKASVNLAGSVDKIICSHNKPLLMVA